MSNPTEPISISGFYAPFHKVGNNIFNPYFCNMNSHNLHIEIPDTSNEDLMLIVDFSKYNDIVPITCPQLLVKPAGFNFTVEIPVEAGFSKVVTACDLGIQKKFCESEFAALPDGVYAVRYSVAPNDQVFVEYNHLRLTQAKNRIAQMYCDMDVNICADEYEKKEIVKKLTEVSEYLNIAKAKIEICHETQKGQKIYEYALGLLDKITCEKC